MFIYCFNEQDRNELESKGYKLVKKDVIDDKEAYVFLNNNKLSFDLDDKKFIKGNTFSF